MKGHASRWGPRRRPTTGRRWLRRGRRRPHPPAGASRRRATSRRRSTRRSRRSTAGSCSAIRTGEYDAGDAHAAWALAHALRALGNTLATLGRTDEAVAPLEEALDLAREIDNEEGVAHCCRGLGVVARQRGAYGTAADRLDAVAD